MNEQEKRKALEAYCEHYCLDITEADRFPESRVAWLAAWEARGRASGQQVGESTNSIGYYFGLLKDGLRNRISRFVEHNSWNGDTESGFYSTDDFDFDKLCAEIDKLGEEIRAAAPQISAPAEHNDGPYGQGFLGDGVCVLRDGVPVPIDEVIKLLNKFIPPI